MEKTQQEQAAATLRRFDETVFGSLRRLGALRTGLLLSVSGGADSTALLCSCARVQSRLGLTLEVVCFDHGLRAEAADEVLSVLALAGRFKLTAHSEKLALAPGHSLEARARSARYAALEKLRQARGLRYSITAHTASDQAETLLMRLGRGAALGGAAGVLPRKGAVLRPLLGVTRQQVEGYLAALNQPFVSDPMNGDPAFLRVRVRRSVLPALEEALGFPAAPALARFAALAQEDDAFLEAQAAASLNRLRVKDTLDAVGVRALAPPILRRVLARFLGIDGAAIDSALIDDAVDGVRAGRTVTLPADRLLRESDGWLGVVPAPPRLP